MDLGIWVYDTFQPRSATAWGYLSTPIHSYPFYIKEIQGGTGIFERDGAKVGTSAPFRMQVCLPGGFPVSSVITQHWELEMGLVTVPCLIDLLWSSSVRTMVFLGLNVGTAWQVPVLPSAGTGHPHTCRGSGNLVPFLF